MSHSIDDKKLLLIYDWSSSGVISFYDNGRYLTTNGCLSYWKYEDARFWFRHQTESIWSFMGKRDLEEKLKQALVEKALLRDEDE